MKKFASKTVSCSAIPVEGQFETSPKRESVHCRNDRFLANAGGETHEATIREEGPFGVIRRVVSLKLFLQIRATTKRPLALARDHSYSQLRFVIKPLPQSTALPVTSHGDRVHLSLTIYRDLHDMLARIAELEERKLWGLGCHSSSHPYELRGYDQTASELCRELA